MTCVECRAEIEPAALICPRCGARAPSSSAGREGSDWREQVRETVARHKERKKAELEKRDGDARQLSIFPEQGLEEDEGEKQVRLRRAEIRARVQDRIAKRGASARSIPRMADAGEIPLSRTKAAMTARKLESEPEPLHEDPRRAELLPLREPSHHPDFEMPYAQPEPEAVPERFEALGMASALERVVAGALDLAFVALIQLTLFYLTTHLVARRLGALPQSALAAMGLVGLVMAAGYFLFFWSLSGQTLGKLLTGSRVVDRRGSSLGFGRAALRLVATLVAALPLGAGFIGLWSDPERRGWHDRIAGTRVIRG